MLEFLFGQELQKTVCAMILFPVSTTDNWHDYPHLCESLFKQAVPRGPMPERDCQRLASHLSMVSSSCLFPGFGLIFLDHGLPHSCTTDFPGAPNLSSSPCASDALFWIKDWSYQIFCFRLSNRLFCDLWAVCILGSVSPNLTVLAKLWIQQLLRVEKYRLKEFWDVMKINLVKYSLG